MKSTKTNYAITNVFYFLIFFVFCLCSVFLILICTKVHSNLNNNIEQNNKMRASYNYIVNKIRACEYPSDISVEDNVILIITFYGDEEYVNRIYEYDGIIYEDLSLVGYEFEYGNGEKIISTEYFSVTHDADKSQVYIDIKDEKGVILKAQVHLR